ncbi:hypothetical protein QFZ66_002664 [Streptomyces sp. B4I13]|uniref:hypothetical protein n=1 Tax=Streptomyces sp. B4I13 TaxID=3042271 RepID=UPI002785609A|nr:hypothetical protein [Streptomyces sp. B4I13]MDQ0958786.1 hypothetical protein [Streptomyces sp. B4I13]
METSTWSQETRATWESGRGVVLCLVVLSLLGGATWLFFIKGLYVLPKKMCDGTLARGTVTQVLPNARSADHGYRSRGVGDDFSFSCYVTTSNDSSLSGEARIKPLSSDKWLKYYQEAVDRNGLVRVSVGDIQALARIDSEAGTSSVYVPCAPPVVPEYNASVPYAVVGEARVDGSVEVTGRPLGQTLTDFAYRLAQHAYKLAECKDPRSFPERLPRYEDD